MSRIRSRLTYANVISTLCLFLLLGGGSAMALSGSNTVFTDDIVNDHVFSADVRNDTLTGGGLTAADLRAGSVGNSEVQANQITSDEVRDDTLSNGGLGRVDLRAQSVRSSEVTNNSLTGDDIAESTLGQVPSALLGGLGRWTGGGSCEPPETGVFVNCALVTVNLPAPARLLLMGQATGRSEGGPEGGSGFCRIGSTSGPFLESTVTLFVELPETVSPVAVSGVFPSGQHSFGIDCNQNDGDRGIRFQEVGIAAVAISPE